MANNNHTVTARDIMENEALSPFAMGDFLVPYKFQELLYRGMLNSSQAICGNHWITKLIGSTIIHAFILIVVWGGIYIYANLFFKFATFLLACLVRLVRGKGGKKGFFITATYIIAYGLLIHFVYMNWIFPYFFQSISWADILRFGNVM